MASAKNIYMDDEVKLNLTPMIDMTFLLVVFFMLSIDLSRKEFVPLALPVAKSGAEDKTDEKIPRYVINLLPDGNIQLKNQVWELASDDIEKQKQALDALRSQLRELTADPALRNEDRSSKVPVMIHGDREARWQYVQWIMQVCADPKIQVYRIQFAVKAPPKDESGGG